MSRRCPKCGDLHPIVPEGFDPGAPVVFLDIDGVLNSENWMLNRPLDEQNPESFHHKYQIDPAAVGRLNRLVAEAAPVFILSSTWRKLLSPEGMTDVLQARGFTGVIVGATGEGEPMQTGWGSVGCERGDEIAAWREKAGHTGPFAVLDDDSDMNAVREHFIKTSWAVGLLDSDVDQAIRLLKGGVTQVGPPAAPVTQFA